MEKIIFNVYLTNLGKYNEGELVGKWVDVMKDPDWEQELKDIGISDVSDETGEIYDEYFITDYDSNIPNIEKLGEYVPLKALSEIGEQLQTIGEVDKFFALMEVYDSIDDALRDYDDAMLFDASNNEELGEAYADLFGAIQYATDDLSEYFDYERFARDVRIEDPDYIAEIFGEDNDNLSDYNIGVELIDELYGCDNIPDELAADYFDYEQFGRYIAENGWFTDYGFVMAI